MGWRKTPPGEALEPQEKRNPTRQELNPNIQPGAGALLPLAVEQDDA